MATNMKENGFETMIVKYLVEKKWLLDYVFNVTYKPESRE